MVKTVELEIEVDESHRVEFELPDEFPAGRTRVVFEAVDIGTSRGPVFRLGQSLPAGAWASHADSDPVASAIREVRSLRDRHVDRVTD